MQFDLAHPLFANRTGAGVLVAVIDSGIHADHPHINGVIGGIGISEDGRTHDDYTDRIGHGTAVAGAIREKAPAADLYAIRIFEQTLATPGRVLVRAIEHAVEIGARLVNLSLGTASVDTRSALAEVIRDAVSRGTVAVSAEGNGEIDLYPGSLAGAVPIEVDWDCPRHAIRTLAPPGFRLAASGFPRPIPGVSPTRNLQGTSFAVANATGMLARLLEDRRDLTTAAAISAELCPPGPAPGGKPPEDA